MINKSVQLRVFNQPIEVAYFDRSGTNDQTIIYLHGASCSKEDFLASTEINALGHFRIMAFDFPGCGQTRYPENTKIGIDEMVECLDQFIKILNLQNIHLIGHSMGGMVALRYMTKDPFVKSFISVEGNMHTTNGTFSRQVIAGTYDEFKEQIFPKMIESLRASENAGFKVWADNLEKIADPRAFYDVCPSLRDYSDDPVSFEFYSKLQIPKLYMYGAANRDKLTFLSSLNATAEITDADHFPFYDNSDQFYTVLSNFYEDNSL